MGTLLAALLLGALIGLVVGGLGGGGSVLAVPALVYVLGQPVPSATAGSLIVVGATSAVAALAHGRTGHVRWRTGLVFGALGTGGGLAGTLGSLLVHPQVLMLAFSGLVLVASTVMLRQALRGAPTAGAPEAERRPAWLRVVLVASVVGLLTGFFGVGGGFVVVPALVLVLGMAMPEAIGTSLLVLSVNSAAALGFRMTTEVEVDWSVVGPFALTCLLGALAGARLTVGARPERLAAAFAVLLLLVALAVGASAAASLA